MAGKVVSIETRKTPLERARSRVLYALRCAEVGTTDLDIMGEVCEALTRVLDDLEEMAREQGSPTPRAS